MFLLFLFLNANFLIFFDTLVQNDRKNVLEKLIYNMNFVTLDSL
jgi:hypothetical protein